MPGDPTASAGTGEATSLLVSYQYMADIGGKFSTVGDAIDGARRGIYNGFADACGEAGFPGLSAAVAAFGDSANGHLSTIASNVSAISGTIGIFSSDVKSVDTNLPNPLAGLLITSGTTGSSGNGLSLLLGGLTAPGTSTPPPQTGSGVTIVPGVTIGGSGG
jgi:hypothetical protein